MPEHDATKRAPLGDRPPDPLNDHGHWELRQGWTGYPDTIRCWDWINDDPSSPETRQGPSPVREPSDGGNASERPNPGADEAQEIDWSLGAEDYRKVAVRHLRQRDEARAKLDQVRADIENPRGLGEDIALALGDAYAGEAFSDPTFERGTEAILAVLRERLAEPVTDREEPASAPGLPDVLAWLDREIEKIEDHGDDTSGEHKAFCLAHSVVQLAVHYPERWMNEIGARLRASEEPASAWDVEADTHRISEDHEEPAGRVVTGLAMVDACERCTGSKASEEPAGETNPRERLFGFELPEYIGWTEMNGIYQATCVWDPEKVEFSPLFNEDSTSHLAKFLNLHRHGQPVDRQADSEAQR